jgi:pimeloyl-ACP methyl ester carboxylesterase/quercetin dioxygenase-like cupin family protein
VTPSSEQSGTWRRSASVASAIAALLLGIAAQVLATPPDFSERFADVNGTRLRYLIGGSGSPVVLLHGYAQTGHMWDPVLPQLAARHTVVVPDLRGAGGSARPESGYDKKNMAVDIHELVRSLGLGRVGIVGHDIGLMVAYAFAAQFPQGTERLVLMDAFLPGIGPWKDVWLMRDLWHFHFYGKTPLALVSGRERTYFEHFWNDFAADPTKSVSEADREIYAAAYAQPGGMRSGFEYFRNFERDAKDFAELAATPLAVPVLVLTGEKASGTFLIDQARLVATNVKGVVVTGSGHWLIDEAPDKVIPELVAFLDGPTRAQDAGMRQRRLDPKEIGSLAASGPGAGTSGVSGIRTRVLKGDPSQAGLYTIQLEVPANTRIEAHTHPDDRIAVVVSGTWYFGYGPSHDEHRLKPLPPGSFYTEPPDEPHFARTGSEAVVLQIVGVGPTGTQYVDQAAPAAHK